MINYECLKILLVLSSIALVSILSIEYLNRRIIRYMQIIIDSLCDRMQMKNETIELLRAKLKEKEK